MQLTLFPLRLRLSPRRPIGPVRLAPQRARPVARLPQQVLPGDAGVVFRGEEVHALRHVPGDPVGDAADLAAVERQAHHRRQERLGDAERHVGAPGVAPLRDHAAAVNDQPIHRRSRLGRTDQRVVRRFGAKLVGNRNGQILGVGILVPDSERDGFVQFRFVEARGRGLDLAPFAARRKVGTCTGRLAWRGTERERGGERGDRDRGRSVDSRPPHHHRADALVACRSCGRSLSALSHASRPFVAIAWASASLFCAPSAAAMPK